MNVKILRSAYIEQHKYFSARKDAYQTETGKIVDPYYVVEVPESAVAVAVTAENEIVLIEQYRYPANITGTELPGGFIDADEAPEKAVLRELMEETGYSFTAVHSLGKTYSNPGVINNPTNLFLATGGKKTGEQSLDPNEEIKIILRSIDEVKEMMKAGKFPQSLHEVCLRRAFDYSENLEII